MLCPSPNAELRQRQPVAACPQLYPRDPAKVAYCCPGADPAEVVPPTRPKGLIDRVPSLLGASLVDGAPRA